MTILWNIAVAIIIKIIQLGGRYSIGKALVFLCKTRDISGTWRTQFQKGDKSENETAKLAQLCGTVWGTIEYLKDEKELRKYKMKGNLKEGILTAMYEIVSPKQPLDRGSFTLHLSIDGKTMTGCYAWTDDKSTTPQGDDYVWTRIEG